MEQRLLLDGGWLANSEGIPNEYAFRAAGGVGLDSLGNVYVAGGFQTTMRLTPTVGEPITLTSQANSNVDVAFVAKLNPQGQFIWAKPMGGTADAGPALGHLAVVGAQADVYVGGYFKGTVDFGGGRVTSRGGRDMFVAKLDTHGNFQWVVRAGSPADDYLREMAIGSDGAVYLAGSFFDGADFGGVTYRTNEGSADFFLAKLTEDDRGAPSFQWVKTDGTESTDDATGLAIDKSAAGDLIYLTVVESRSVAPKRRLLEYSPTGQPGRSTFLGDGNMNMPITVYRTDADTHYLYVATSSGTITKVDPSGQTIETMWEKSADPDFFVRKLAVDSTGVYAIGTPAATPADFDPDPDRSALLPARRVGALWKLDHDGNFLAARVTADSLPGTDYPAAGSGGIAVHDGAIYTSGSFGGPNARFDIGTEFVSPLNAQGYSNMFVLKTTQERGGIFGRAFVDLDNDRTWDEAEPPLAGFTVAAVAAGTVKATAVTEKGGQFYFPHLQPGVTYDVRLEVPAGWSQTAGGLQGVTVEAGRFVSSSSSDFFGAYTQTKVSRYESTDVPKKYTPQSGRSISSTLTVADPHTILGVEVSITVSGQPPRELLLFGPGTVVKIPPEVYQANGTFTYSTDAFNFANAHGTWTLVIQNGQLGGTGRLMAWSLNIRHPAAVPSISINDVSLAEGNSGTTAFNFTVSLSSAPAQNQTISVLYATANGSATAGSDYLATSGTLTFLAGETRKTITVLVVGDRNNESDETFYVNLSSPVGVTILDGQGLGTIKNDDKKTTASASRSALSSEPTGKDLTALAAAADAYFFDLERKSRKTDRQELGLDWVDIDLLLQV